MDKYTKIVMPVKNAVSLFKIESLYPELNISLKDIESQFKKGRTNYVNIEEEYKAKGILSSIEAKKDIELTKLAYFATNSKYYDKENFDDLYLVDPDFSIENETPLEMKGALESFLKQYFDGESEITFYIKGLKTKAILFGSKFLVKDENFNFDESQIGENKIERKYNWKDLLEKQHSLDVNKASVLLTEEIVENLTKKYVDKFIQCTLEAEDIKYLIGIKEKDPENYFDILYSMCFVDEETKEREFESHKGASMVVLGDHYFRRNLNVLKDIKDNYKKNFFGVNYTTNEKEYLTFANDMLLQLLKTARSTRKLFLNELKKDNLFDIDSIDDYQKSKIVANGFSLNLLFMLERNLYQVIETYFIRENITEIKASEVFRFQINNEKISNNLLEGTITFTTSEGHHIVDMKSKHTNPEIEKEVSLFFENNTLAYVDDFKISSFYTPEPPKYGYGSEKLDKIPLIAFREYGDLSKEQKLTVFLNKLISSNKVYQNKKDIYSSFAQDPSFTKEEKTSMKNFLFLVSLFYEHSYHTNNFKTLLKGVVKTIDGTELKTNKEELVLLRDILDNFNNYWNSLDDLKLKDSLRTFVIYFGKDYNVIDSENNVNDEAIEYIIKDRIFKNADNLFKDQSDLLWSLEDGFVDADPTTYIYPHLNWVEDFIVHAKNKINYLNAENKASIEEGKTLSQSKLFKADSNLFGRALWSYSPYKSGTQDREKTKKKIELLSHFNDLSDESYLNLKLLIPTVQVKNAEISLLSYYHNNEFKDKEIGKLGSFDRMIKKTKKEYNDSDNFESAYNAAMVIDKNHQIKRFISVELKETIYQNIVKYPLITFSNVSLDSEKFKNISICIQNLFKSENEEDKKIKDDLVKVFLREEFIKKKKIKEYIKLLGIHGDISNSLKNDPKTFLNWIDFFSTKELAEILKDDDTFSKVKAEAKASNSPSILNELIKLELVGNKEVHQLILQKINENDFGFIQGTFLYGSANNRTFLKQRLQSFQTKSEVKNIEQELELVNSILSKSNTEIKQEDWVIEEVANTLRAIGRIYGTGDENFYRGYNHSMKKILSHFNPEIKNVLTNMLDMESISLEKVLTKIRLENMKDASVGKQSVSKKKI